jgi:hypothetical protein
MIRTSTLMGSELLFLNHAQKLDLGFRAEGADLIEENGAVVGDFEISLLGLNGAGKGAPHVAEQGGFQQVRRQRTAVDGHEHPLAARRVGVDGLGDEFLAGAGIAGDQDGRAAGGDLGHQVQLLDHALALADDIGEAVALLQGALEVGILVFQAPGRDHAIDFDDELFVVPGLGEVVVGAQLEGLDGGFHRAVGGDHENGRLAVVRAHVLKHLHAGTVGHHQIEKHQVVAVRFHAAEPFGGVGGALHRVAGVAQKHLQAFANIRLVIDYQNPAFGGHRGGRRSHRFRRHSPVSFGWFWPAEFPAGSGRRRRGD